MKSKIDIVLFIGLLVSGIVNFLLWNIGVEYPIKWLVYTFELYFFVILCLWYSKINKKLISEHENFKTEILKQDLEFMKLERMKQIRQEMMKLERMKQIRQEMMLQPSQHSQYNNETRSI
jgi:hypothetical protein